MQKHDKMVALAKEKSAEMTETAITAIETMYRKNIKISVAELTKLTGLSRGFFYNNTDIGGGRKGGLFQMWTISKVLAMAVLTGLSVMDYRIRKVPRDVLLLCMAGVIIYQVLTGNVDWKLSVAGGLSGILFLWISKITNEAIGYGDSLAILILGIYLGIWGLLEVLMTAFFILGIIGLICVVIKRKKKGLAFPFYPFLTVGYLLGVCIGGI